ncbi:MAG: class I SAM-dependent methyltransferase [Hyphomicrobiales bacterium]|nr:class I SAM-dependent methyltransferase [Hyphomicrobiales bacterium]
MTNNLKQEILRSIAITGPMPISQYMHLCNAHPQLGYYSTGNPVGKDGDFITAPEVSQMFGELIGLWGLQAWHTLNCPDPVQIVELGPGRGTMINDIIRSIKTSQKFSDATEIRLVETSPSMKSEQQLKLAEHSISIQWVENIEELPPIPAIFIANEFLDAIPFRQFVKTIDGWRELCVGLNGDNQPENNQLAFVVGSSGLEENLLPPGHENEPIGAIFEHAPAREAISILIAQHINTQGGAALIIDYGHEISGFGDTFQAVQSHQPISTLTNPGHCDLTCHVDFQAISDVAIQNGLKAGSILTQQDFLLAMGLLERAGRLGHDKSASVQQKIQQDVHRLVADDQMGKLFKVLCLTQSEYPMPLFDHHTVGIRNLS